MQNQVNVAPQAPKAKKTPSIEATLPAISLFGESRYSKEELALYVEEVIGEMANLNPGEFNPVARLKEDYGFDSLDMIEMVMIIEKDHKLHLADKEWQSMVRAGEIVELLSAKLLDD
ncbi:MAG: acyl carrier protein [Bacteroidota bacterium]